MEDACGLHRLPDLYKGYYQLENIDKHVDKSASYKLLLCFSIGKLIS